MKYLPLALSVILFLLFTCCEKKVAQPAQSAPIIATFSKGNGTSYYKPLWVKYSGATLSFLGCDTIGTNTACVGYDEISLVVYTKKPGSFLLSYYPANYVYTDSYGYCSMNEFFYNTDSTHTGTVNITLLDTINHVTSGTFNFTAEMALPMRDGGTETASNGSFTNLKW